MAMMQHVLLRLRGNRTLESYAAATNRLQLRDGWSFVWGLPEDFNSLEERDETHLFHVEFRSFFEEPQSEADVRELATSHPLAPDERHFIHTVESVMGPLVARGAEHVWKWNGEDLKLLETAWREWVS